MLVNTTALRFTSSSRVGGISLRAPAPNGTFSNEVPAQSALSLRAFPANPTYPLGSQVLSTLLELQAEENEVDEDGRRKENSDQPRDKKAK